MLDGIPLGAIDGVGTVGVVLIVGWLIFTGRLVPRRTYDDKIHEANEWRAESRIKDAQIAEKDKQLAHMGEIGHTVESFLGAFQRAAKKVEESP